MDPARLFQKQPQRYFRNYCLRNIKPSRSNPILEKLTVTHISVPLLLFYGASIGLISYGILSTQLSGWKIAGLFWIGLFFWTFFEYIMHRHVFHIIDHLPSAHRFQYIIHGIHHEYPKDRKRLIMPPLMSATLDAIHHFKDDTLAYGVSSPLWDYIFGTMPKRGKEKTQKHEAKVVALH